MNKKHFLNKLLIKKKIYSEVGIKNYPINTIKDKDVLIFKLIKSLINTYIKHSIK